MKLKKIKFKNILLVILVCVFIYATIQIVSFIIDTNANKKEIKQLKDDVIKKDDDKPSNEDTRVIDFDKLLSINSDTMGWINYNSNKIDYPIVKSSDNEYYLNRTFEKSYNQAGSIFMDYRNKSFDDKNVVLYGHAMKDNTMFGSLKDIFNKGFFDIDDNNYIRVTDTNNTEITYKIFSYYIIESEEYYITTSFDSDDSFKSFVNTLIKRSYRDFNVEVSSDDNILTLSTCYGSTGTSKRKVIHAKRLK